MARVAQRKYRKFRVSHFRISTLIGYDVIVSGMEDHYFLLALSLNLCSQFQITGDAQQDCAGASSTAEARLASQIRPVTGGETAASQNQDSQAAAVGSVAQSDEDKQASPALGKERPMSQCAVAEEKSASRTAAEEGTTSRPQTDKGRPASNVSAGSGAPSSSK
ncbi:hypothetical protein F2P81_011881 [Scophthalmus maximus]|uniref:Uncharacterized protein n=1 Tax=Scophthalmus maximus TaxID=52904 RepID=A0A6A4SV74_SCOMX|nr:hypothetical protein F2P81_011881 [Scophthalmus maximus]